MIIQRLMPSITGPKTAVFLVERRLFFSVITTDNSRRYVLGARPR